jgi:hypothetical protein
VQASLSLPGSPFHRRSSRGSYTGSHYHTWRAAAAARHHSSDGRLRSSFLEAQDLLPYMDDSRAVSPNGSLLLDGGGGFPFHDSGYYNSGGGGCFGVGGRHSRQNSYSSHTSRITYNSHAELTRKGGSRELHWRRRSGTDRESQWGHWLTSWQQHAAANNNNNDVPSLVNGGYNNNNNGGGSLARSSTPSPVAAAEAADRLPQLPQLSSQQLPAKTILPEVLVVDKQRLSVQFPVCALTSNL